MFNELITKAVLNMPIYNWILFTLIAIFTILNEGVLNEAYNYYRSKAENITFFGLKLFFGQFDKDKILKQLSIYYRLTFILTITSIILFIIFYLNYALRILFN